MIVDSHCHLDQLDLTPYGGDIKLALEAAKKNDVGHFLCVSIDLDTFPKILEIANQFDQVNVSVGLHPNEKVDIEPTQEQLVALAQNKKVIAIGETGLDYYRSEGDLEWQRNRFRCHIRAAKESKKPLIIHTRMASEDTLNVMREEKAHEIGGVMHCFTESLEVAERSMEMNFYISFSGIVTFQNAKELREVAKKVPLERMLIETDSPYLAPMPFRGKPNEPAYVKYVAECIAELRGISYQEVAEKTTENFFRLFLKK
ncbi:MAG: TatD family hydrolase [Proteobacteria bacterium]|nr:TatD family hydrolase [Pseudomonadota bacterium]